MSKALTANDLSNEYDGVTTARALANLIRTAAPRPRWSGSHRRAGGG